MINCLADKENKSSLAIIRLFEKMIQDQKEKAIYAGESTYGTAGASYGGTVFTGGTTASGTTVISYSNTQDIGGSVPKPLDEESIYNVVGQTSSTVENTAAETEASPEV